MNGDFLQKEAVEHLHPLLGKMGIASSPAAVKEVFLLLEGESVRTVEIIDMNVRVVPGQASEVI